MNTESASDIPRSSSSPRAARLCDLCLRMPAAYIGALRISYGLPRDYPGGHPPLPPPVAPRVLLPKSLSLRIAVRVMHFRTHRRNSFIPSCAYRKRRMRPPSRARARRNPVRFFETQIENKGKKRDVDSIARRLARLNFSDLPIYALNPIVL